MSFKPTHEITFNRPSGKPAAKWIVMLSATGAAYQDFEWKLGMVPVWCRRADGVWCYNGEPTPYGSPGTVAAKPLE